MRFANSVFILKLLGAYGAIVTSIVTVLAWGEPKARAVLCMAWGLILLWIVLGGILTRIYRQKIRNCILHIRFGWKLKFVLFCTILALIEEAITTTMTNLAPLFGVKIGQAYITASTNYLDVVLCHSVVVFVPMFIGWTWILNRYDFKPATVMLLFGLTGTWCEVFAFGPQHIAEVGFWVFVYGLMIYLPAYCLPDDRTLKKPRSWHYPMAIFFPTLFTIPVAIIVGLLHPTKIHFPQ